MPRKPPSFRKLPYSHFEITHKLLNLSPGELCEKIGYDRTAAGAWRISGEMPHVAKIACDYVLVQAQGAGIPILCFPGAKHKALREVLSAMTIPFQEIKV